MKISKKAHGTFAWAMVASLGLAYGLGLMSATSGLSSHVGRLWVRANPFASPHSPATSSAPIAARKSGPEGFDFTRIGRNGDVLMRQDAPWQNAGDEAEGTQWDCLRDNVSGLWWEAKTNHESGGVKHLRHVDHTYSGDDSTQALGARCSGLPDAGTCHAQSYVDAVNATGLCGFRDWRLPSVAELKSLTSINKGGATIDVVQFPNTAPSGYWTASAYPHRKNYLWYVFFAGAGDAFGDAPSANHAVRLVRNGT